MQRLRLRTVQNGLRVYGILVTGLVAAGILAAAFTLGVHHAQLHEGGLPKVYYVPSLATKVNDVAADAAVVKTAVAAASASSCAQNRSGKLLLVSITQQHIWACDGTNVVKDSAVTTGASALTNVDDATPTGTWKIYSKQTNTTLKGCDVNGCWNDPVAYWMPFDDQVGFHDASWQAFPFGSSQYTTQGSHGCVHLPAEIIAWVYGWAPIGTNVTIKA
jgi:lipoprotein-anchoring transpeptidase ErfK/SrfK